MLLSLITKQKIDIYDIPIALIFDQYMEYIEEARMLDMEVAGEFITMAAQLMQIKSKMLLPVYEDEGEEDPRTQLVEQLLEYQRFKEAGGYLGGISETGRDLYIRPQEHLEKDYSDVVYDHTAEQLAKAIDDILQRAQRRMPPPITAFKSIVGKEAVPVNGRITHILQLFTKTDTIKLETLLLSSKSRSEIVAYFLAILELSKNGRLVLEYEEDDYYLRLSAENMEAADGVQ